MKLLNLLKAHPLVSGAVILGGGAIVLGGSSKRSSRKRFGTAGIDGFVGVPPKAQPTTTGTWNPSGDGPAATKAPVKGFVTITYSQANRAGNVGGLVALNQKDSPLSVYPTAGSSGGIVNVDGIVGKISELVDIWTGGEYYPDSWTEPQGQIDEIYATSFGEQARVWMAIDLYAHSGTKWYFCRRIEIDEYITVSRVITVPPVEEVPGQKALIPCLYSQRRYAEAGLSVDLVPRPGTPGEVEVHAMVSLEAGVKRLALFLWLPPRLGRHMAKVAYQIWK